MITLIENQNKPKQKTSESKLWFRCSCGNVCKVAWRDFNNGTKTCRKCKLFIFKNSGKTKFNRLKLIDKLEDIKNFTQKVLWKCDCGKEKKIAVTYVVNGSTKSCGCSRSKYVKKNHPVKTKTYWMEKIKTIKDIDLPDSWSAGSVFMCTFICDCGNIYKKRFCDFKEKSTCLKCNIIDIKKDNSFGSFIYKGTKTSIKTTSIEKDLFMCSCGKTKHMSFYSIFHKNKKTCGECNKKSVEWWKKTKFGKCKAQNYERISELSIFSNKKEFFICDCGTIFNRKVCNVTNKKTSCGKCREVSTSWHSKNLVTLKNLNFPLKKQDFPTGGPKPLENIRFPSKKTKFQCWLCKKKYETIVLDVIRGYSLSCGCASGQISKANVQIKNFVESLGVNSETEYVLNEMKYDVGIPSKKLLIEHHGIKWHSLPDSKLRDIKKYKNALKNGWEIMVIFEDEWSNKRTMFENLIKNRLGLLKQNGIRGSKCTIERIKSKEANNFYEKFHYIGKCQARFHYGVFSGKKLLCCASFRLPTRQSMKQEYEISRMASEPNFRIHGVWNKILKKFTEEIKPNSIVSFSDNRLFTGNVYEKMGFKLDGEVKPDYYWTVYNKRYHKSSLRKIKDSKITETQLRKSQGYEKIWDLGKKRWVRIN